MSRKMWIPCFTLFFLLPFSCFFFSRRSIGSLLVLVYIPVAQNREDIAFYWPVHDWEIDFSVIWLNYTYFYFFISLGWSKQRSVTTIWPTSLTAKLKEFSNELSTKWKGANRNNKPSWQWKISSSFCLDLERGPYSDINSWIWRNFRV